MAAKNKFPKILLLVIAGIILIAIISTLVFVFNLREGLFPKAISESSNSISTSARIDPAEILEVEFVFNENQNRLHLVRGTNQFWKLTDQTKKELPQDEIDYAIQLAATLEEAAENAEPFSSTLLGFNPPTAKLTLTLSDGSSHLIEIGKVDQESGQYAVRNNSGDAFLADFNTVYSILKIFYLKVLPVALDEESQPNPIEKPGN